MRRSSALLVSSLLLVAGVFAPIGVGANDAAKTNPLIVPMNDTANHLAVQHEAVTATGVATDGLSLSTAIDGDTAAMQSELIRGSFERSFRQATNAPEKAAAIRSVADRIDDRQERLQRRDRAAVRAYADGSMTTRELVRERARIHNTAEALRATIRFVDNTARSDDNYSPSAMLRIRLANLAGELEILTGPVSGHASRAAGGEAASQTVYAEASEGGYTLAYVTDDTYVRETYLRNERDANATDTFAAADAPRGNAARLRGYELYPWVVNNSLSPAIHGLGRSGIYKFTADFTDGELTAYIDGGTTNVFRESQRYKLAAMPISNTVTNDNATLHVQVNKTYESGPLKVALTRNGTGAPVDGTVTVDGNPVGQTGDDGTLWIVEPRGPNRIEATAGANETVSVYLPS